MSHWGTEPRTRAARIVRRWRGCCKDRGGSHCRVKPSIWTEGQPPLSIGLPEVLKVVHPRVQVQGEGKTRAHAGVIGPLTLDTCHWDNVLWQNVIHQVRAEVVRAS